MMGYGKQQFIGYLKFNLSFLDLLLKDVIIKKVGKFSLKKLLRLLFLVICFKEGKDIIRIRNEDINRCTVIFQVVGQD